MNTNKLTTEQLILIVFIMMALINGLMSCSSVKYNSSLVTGSTHKATRYKAKQLMKYSTWKYVHPETEVMIPGSKSNFIFETNNTNK